MINRRHNSTKRMHPRRGSFYIVVLGTSMIVSLLGLSALTVHRITRRSYEESNDLFQARQNALTALKMGMLRIKQDPDWRYNFRNGVWEADSNVHGSGAGTYSIDGQDSTDSDLTDSPTDPLVLIGIGKKGNAIQKVQITLVPQKRPLSCLEVGMHSGEEMKFDEATLNFNGTISSNDRVSEEDGSSIDVNTNVEAVNSITGNFPGTTTTGVNPRDLPDSTTVFDYYKNNGTWIDINDIVLPPPASIASGPNILNEGDMEGTPLTDWYAIGGGQADVTSTAHGGAQALLAKSRAVLTDTVGQDITSSLEKGAGYYAEAWVRQSNASTNFRLMLKLVSGGEGTQYIPFSLAESAPVDTYVKVFGETTVSWSGPLTMAEIYIENQSNSSADFFVDDATMYMTSEPPPPARTIYRTVLSPNSNPYGSGTTNAQGIYVIDCLGQNIHIQDSRIVGTLVLLNTGGGSDVRKQGSVNWAPSVSNFPALLVDGDFKIKANNNGLNETFEGTNFNPTGTPDPALSPTQDSDTDDTYPSQIKGLIYVSGNLKLEEHPVVDGVIVSDGTITIKGTLDLTYQQTPAINPPPGFNSSEEIRILLNSVTKTVD